MTARTMFAKVWDQHVVVAPDGDAPAVLYIDLHLVHEVTSPQAFAALAARGLWRGDARWARAVFLASIVYLPTVYTAMVIDGRL